MRKWVGKQPKRIGKKGAHVLKRGPKAARSPLDVQIRFLAFKR